jgi:flavin-dependent dehydrogenase
MNTVPAQTCDVLIIGGGPAGSAMGALLAERGRKVLVLEKDRHPRFHIGESLLPLSLPFFERLGVQDDIERIGLRKYAAEFHSMYHGRQSDFRFGEAVDKSYPYAYEVRRSEFDHVLIRNCAAKGAEVREGWRVTGAELAGDEITAVTAVDEAGTEHRFKAAFYVDATGRDTFLADLLRTKERNRRHASAALYGHFSGALRNAGQEEGNISIYWFDHGWFWFIPLKDGITSVGAVCTPAYLKTRQVPVEQFFFDTIALCPGVQQRLAAARLENPVTATGNYSYQSTKMYGRNFLLVGDAYAFIDPVFSSGVHLALQGAFRGAETVDRILADPRTAGAELEKYRREIEGGLRTFSWFIYRITTPAVRDLFMYPRNILGVKEGVLSLLAGDLFRETPLKFRLLVFRAIYYLTTLLMPKASLAAHRRRRKNLAV